GSSEAAGVDLVSRRWPRLSSQPMTAEHVARHAAERPDAIAVLHDGRAISFAQLSADIRKTMSAVIGLELARGACVAIGADDLYVHWLLLLACEQLGIAAASFMSGEGAAAAPLLSSVDLVLAEPHFPRGGSRRHHVIAPEWRRDVLASSGAGELRTAPRSPDDPVRLL